MVRGRSGPDRVPLITHHGDRENAPIVVRPLSARLVSASAAALLLAACGSGEDSSSINVSPPSPPPAPPSSPVQDDAGSSGAEVEGEEDAAGDDVRLEPGAAAWLTSVPDIGLTEIEQDDGTVVETVDQVLTVIQVLRGPKVPVDVAEQVLADQPVGEVDLSGATEVAAADGETFVVAVVRVDDPRWEPVDADPTRDQETSNVVRVAGNEIDLDVDLEAGDQGTVLLSVPEDTSPEDVVLESISDGMSQEISLVDGTRTASDVEHIYSRPAAVEIGESASWSHDYDSRRGLVTHSGEVIAAHVSPMVPAHGWADPGNVLLGVDVSTQDLPNPHLDNSTIRLRLEDGSTVQPEVDPKGTDGPFSRTAWFQLPVDAVGATVVISIETQLGTEHYEVATIEVPVTTVRDDATPGPQDETGTESAS